MTVKVVLAPSAEPITLTEAKAHLRVSHSNDDTVIEACLKAAARAVENFTQRALVPRTLRLTLDSFPDYGYPILLPFSPVRSIDHIKHYDADGALTTWSSTEFFLDNDAEPARVLHLGEYAWPTSMYAGRLGAVQIQYQAGYEPGMDSPTDYGENIPDDLKAAVKLILGDLFEHREDTVIGNPASLPRGAEALMWPYRILRDC
jgi:uncharacterized phiE125 gp8 family phage protein